MNIFISGLLKITTCDGESSQKLCIFATSNKWCIHLPSACSLCCVRITISKWQSHELTRPRGTTLVLKMHPVKLQQQANIFCSGNYIVSAETIRDMMKEHKVFYMEMLIRWEVDFLFFINQDDFWNCQNHSKVQQVKTSLQFCKAYIYGLSVLSLYEIWNLKYVWFFRKIEALWILL